MAKIKLNKTELVDKFYSQLEKLRMFCEIYDSGDISIITELAVKLRVLFHQSSNPNAQSKSLFSQLKLDEVLFFDSGHKYEVENIMNHTGLVSTSFDSSTAPACKYIPTGIEQGYYTMSTFESWWSNKKIIVIKDKSQFVINEGIYQHLDKSVYYRKTLIAHLCDTDGGAHVDKEIDYDYYQLSRNYKSDITGGFIDSKTQRITFSAQMDPVPPSVRQISEEVLYTFKEIDILQVSKVH